MITPSLIRLVRGHIVHFLGDPSRDEQAIVDLVDGGLWIEQGKIVACKNWSTLLQDLSHRYHLTEQQLKHISSGVTQQLTLSPIVPNSTIHIHDYQGRLILPGFVDTHVHFAQTKVIGSFGCELLDWLTQYTFPQEMAFADAAYSDVSAEFFIQRLLAHGTTTASVYATVHPHSVDSVMHAAQQSQLRILAGKVMMDRHAPSALCDEAHQSAQQSADLIARWHGIERLRYSITPRFAPTSTALQLQLAGELFHSHADVHLQTHLSENLSEIAWVKQLFPQQSGYWDVYAHYGLIGKRSIFGHCIHLSAEEVADMAAAGSAAAFCPSSNLFLGSGLMNYQHLHAAGVQVGLGSDVGGGTSLSMLRTLADAYKALQLRQYALTAWQGFYLLTLGGAKALYLDEYIGNFEPGKEADFVVLNPAATEDLSWRLAGVSDTHQQLFALMSMGDERCIEATHILGKKYNIN